MQLTVIVPIADLRKEPYLGKPEKKDPLQESQLLFGERVRVLDENEEWWFVECESQEKYSSTHHWHPYPGWIQKNKAAESNSLNSNLIVYECWASLYEAPDITSECLICLPLGSFLEGLAWSADWWKVRWSENNEGFIQAKQVRSIESIKKTNEVDRRKSIISMGQKFLHTPYLWGGKSFYHPHYATPTGIDCSGLSHLLYQVHGIALPRNAHDQYLKSKRCEAEHLKLGDLVFIAGAETNSRISHVMMVSENDKLLESAMEPYCVREIESIKRFGCSLKELKENTLKDSRLLFGCVI